MELPLTEAIDVVTRSGRFLVALAALATISEASTTSIAFAEPRPYHELDPRPKVVALTPGVTGAAFTAFLDRTEAAGYSFAVAVAGAGAVVLDVGNARNHLRADRAVARVLADGPDTQRSFASPEVEGLVAWWNRGFDTPDPAPTREMEPEEVRCGGAFVALDGARNCSGGGELDVVQYAAGRSAVNLVFPEGIYNPWDTPGVVAVTAELVRALNWWNLKSGGFSQFILIERGRVITGTEPAETMLEGEGPWVIEALDALGYPGSCAALQVDALNRASRDEYASHWAFTEFVINGTNFVGAPGVLAYAYLGGPYTVSLRGNGGLGTQYLDQVMAHEMGHIFQALDEYTGGCGSCSARSGYMSVVNGNCAACGHPEGKCIMRNASTYDHDERENMETMIHPCRFTKGEAGFWDGNFNGIMDVLETRPETELVSTLPDTLDGSTGVSVVAMGWDEPVPTPVFPHPRSINRVGYAEWSLDGQPWQRARATDGFFIDEIEEFEAVLPELGGGQHYVRLRSVNTAGVVDNSPPQANFFVYDVKLKNDLEVFQEGTQIAITWQIDGEDFGSVYKLYRREPGREESQIASVPSLGRRNDRHRYFDAGIQPGSDYVYRLEVEIPGKGRKLLGSASFSPVLADAADGGFLAAAPNPSRGSFLLSVRVPVGPRPGRPDVLGLPDDFGNPPNDDIAPVIPAQRSDGPTGGDDGGTEFTPQWRDVRIAVYDVTGRLVRNLGTTRAQETTRFNAVWDGNLGDGTPVRPGAYFVLVDVGYASETRKVVIVH